MTMMKITAFLCLLPSLASATWYDFRAYKPYPPEFNALLHSTSEALKNSAPRVRTLGTMLETEEFEKLQQVAVRNSDLFHLDVNYVIGDGVDQGCRVFWKGQGHDKEHGVRGKGHHRGRGQKPWCNDHCTHGGRYCPAFPREELATKTHHNGTFLVQEVLRRLCIGETVDRGFSNETFFDYMKQFEQKKCMDSQDLNKCSTDILNNLEHVNTTAGLPFHTCLNKLDGQKNDENPLLEQQLDVAFQLQYELDELPVLEIGDDLYDKTNGDERADHIQYQWCDHFDKDKVKPVSCEFCVPECNYIKDCLWSNVCDKAMPITMQNYKRPVEALKEFHEANKPKEQPPKEDKPKEQPPKENNKPKEQPPKEDNKPQEGGTAPGAATQSPHFNKMKPKPKAQQESIEEEVVDDTKILLGMGFAAGIGVTAILWMLAECKRRRAVAEVAKELPMDGFRDQVHDDEEFEMGGFKDEPEDKASVLKIV